MDMYKIQFLTAENKSVSGWSASSAQKRSGSAVGMKCPDFLFIYFFIFKLSVPFGEPASFRWWGNVVCDVF